MTRDIGSRQIAPPAPDKPPLKVNAFLAMRSSNTALSPLFPYAGDGDLVPCASILWGGENRDMGVFNHTNSVDEVAICFAAENSRARPGFAYVGSRTHLVGRFFENPSDPANLHASIVTQRQSGPGIPQSETLTFICEACQTPLLRHEFSSKNDRAAGADLPGYTPPLETVMEGAECLEEFNADVARRTCTQCGKINDPFPVSVWGWDNYRHHAVAAERARRLMLMRVAQIE